MTTAAPVLLETKADLQARYALLFRQLLWLALPVLAENILHMLVGLTDVYLASHLPQHAAAATAAVGSITYVLWLVGLVAGAVATGSTALIARAVGARHRSLANNVCGQSISASFAVGVVSSLLVIALATPLAAMIGLSGVAHDFSLFYLRVLCWSLPFNLVMFTANACLRGAGDSVTPAIAMIVVDLVNMFFSAALTRGWFGFPLMGFRGIAIGTVIAYAAGGILQAGVLFSGWGKLTLYRHRLAPHWLTLKRILRIGLPSGLEGLISWLASFSIVILINRVDVTNVIAAAHIVTVRIESLSFMAGLAVATAAATMVGQSLGMRNPLRAKRSALIAYLLGAAIMCGWSLAFIFAGRRLTGLLAEDAHVADLAAKCLFVTAFAQPGFAAAMIFGGALRGAGDTFVVMVLNLASVLVLRLAGVLMITLIFHRGLQAIWIILASDLTIRGLLVTLRLAQGGWKNARV